MNLSVRNPFYEITIMYIYRAKALKTDHYLYFDIGLRNY